MTWTWLALAVVGLPQEAAPLALELATDERADVIGVRAVDLDGRVHKLGMAQGTAPVALVFLDTECPIANRFAPRLSELAGIARECGVEFFGVLSSPDLAASAARKHRDEHELSFPVLFDANGDLAERLRPTHVPEAFVVRSSDTLAYRGRIDDRFASLGTMRPVVGAHDLADALRAVSAGKDPETPRTQPVGCLFEAWDEPDPEVTYAREIAPILDANCVECHRAGDIAPFALGDFDSAQRRARMLAEVCAERSMPPWRALRGHGAFRDERFLGEREIAALRAWAAAGAPQGDATQRLPAPAAPTTRWRFGEPDLVVEMPEPYPVSASGEDVYRYFVVPSELVEDQVIVGYDFRPGDASVVHHCIVYLDDTGWGARLDATDDAPGFSVRGNEQHEDEAEKAAFEMLTVTGWAPGAEPCRLPSGLGQRLPAGGDFILEVHYHPSGKATSDRSALALYFAEAPVERFIEGLVIGTENIDIPPGEPEYRRHVYMELPADVDLIDVTPHMHNLGKEVLAVALLPDGDELDLLRIDDWDFRWQTTYTYREPVFLPKGSVVDVSLRFDNSAENPNNPSSPPIRVEEGWQTTDEMCLFYLTIVPHRPADMDAIYMAMFASFMRSGAPE